MGSYVSMYDNLFELYLVEFVMVGVEVEDEDDEESGGSYVYLDDIFQYVWGLQ